MSVVERLTAALSDRYRLERELGQGGMATVYLAHDIKHERDVAIKVLHPDLGAALGGERFLTEIRTTARLQHPHILPLLDSGNAVGLLYYVMPLVTGETLQARCRHHGAASRLGRCTGGGEVAAAVSSRPWNRARPAPLSHQTLAAYASPKPRCPMHPVAPLDHHHGVVFGHSCSCPACFWGLAQPRGLTLPPWDPCQCQRQ